MIDMPVWGPAFLVALERTGCVVGAAAAVGVTSRGAQKARLRVPALAAAWGLALKVWRAERAAGLLRTELAAGSRIAGTFGGVAAPRLERPGVPLSEEAIERFLDMLAATANVRRAAAAAGATPGGFYARRRRDEHFRASWDAALDSGRARLEALLLARAIRRFDPEEVDVDGERAEIGEVSADEALRLLAMGQGKPAGQGRETWRKRRTLDEVRDSILRKIAAIERHDAAHGGENPAGEAPRALRDGPSTGSVPPQDGRSD